MGLYIPGMKMPPKGEAYLVDPDGVVYRYIPTDDGEDHIVRKIDAKPVELPPHGRLIDADALEFLYEESADGWRHTPVFMDFFKACAKGVREMPTIIPAEGGANDG